MFHDSSFLDAPKGGAEYADDNLLEMLNASSFSGIRRILRDFF
jgi:hypothetical protein